MTKFEKLLIISSLCVTSFVSAQNYGYDQYSQSSNPNYPSNQSGQYRDGDYRNSGSAVGDQRNSNQNNQSSWLNWFGNSEKTPNVPDEVITTRVIQNIRNTPYFSNLAKNIQVLVREGKVTLKGRVANTNEKNQIEYMVKNVEGVKSVTDDLETEK